MRNYKLSVIDYAWLVAPEGHQQDRQDFEEWERTIDETSGVYFTWVDRGSVLIDMENQLVETETEDAEIREFAERMQDYMRV